MSPRPTGTEPLLLAQPLRLSSRHRLSAHLAHLRLSVLHLPDPSLRPRLCLSTAPAVLQAASHVLAFPEASAVRNTTIVATLKVTAEQDVKLDSVNVGFLLRACLAVLHDHRRHLVALFGLHPRYLAGARRLLPALAQA